MILFTDRKSKKKFALYPVLWYIITEVSRMKKRFATVVVLVCILVSLCGCGKAELTDILNNTTEEYSYKAPTITEAPITGSPATSVTHPLTNREAILLSCIG